MRFDTVLSEGDGQFVRGVWLIGRGRPYRGARGARESRKRILIPTNNNNNNNTPHSGDTGELGCRWWTPRNATRSRTRSSRCNALVIMLVGTVSHALLSYRYSHTPAVWDGYSGYSSGFFIVCPKEHRSVRRVYGWRPCAWTPPSACGRSRDRRGPIGTLGMPPRTMWATAVVEGRGKETGEKWERPMQRSQSMHSAAPRLRGCRYPLRGMVVWFAQPRRIEALR